MQNILTFVILRHPVTILVTDLPTLTILFGSWVKGTRQLLMADETIPQRVVE